MVIEYLFPFASVPPNSRVIIYGYGNVGKQFILQLTQSEYARVVYCVDQAAAKMNVDTIPIKSIDDVDWRGDGYDYVIIAIQNNKISTEVFLLLQSKGVDTKKIVLFSGKPMSPAFMPAIRMQSVFSSRKLLKNILSAYCRSEYKHLHILYDMREWLGKNDTPLLRMQLKKWLSDTVFLTPDEQAVLLQQIYLAGIFDDEFLKLMLTIIPKVSRWQDGYSMLMDMGVIDRYLDEHIDWRYPDFYHDMRLAIKEVFDKSPLYMRPNCKKKKYVKRIAFSITFIHSVRYALGAILPLMNSFAENGFQVGLFSLGTSFYDENELPQFTWQPMSKRQDMKSHGSDAQGYEVYLEEKKFYHPSIKVYDSYKLPVVVKLQEYLDEIDSFSPDIIIMFVDDRMILSYVMSKYYPVILIPTKRLQSGLYFHTFLSGASKDKCLYDNRKFNSLPEDRIRTFESDGIPFLGYLDQRKYERRSFGITEEDFVVVTVGARLEKELTIDFIDSMAKLIEKNSRVKWMLVYRCEPKIVQKYDYLIRSGRIIMRGWEENLPALYKICNACINPERDGGGVSLRLAMQAGLPVVSKDVPPLSGFLAPENFITGGLEEMTFELEKMTKDEEYYARKCNLMKKTIERLKQSAELKIEDVLQETYDKFYRGYYQ